ncbi:exosome RNA helicase MTR4 [Hetaerina americana]|uniref:exosome RNA helicase MTR4 n=1 Tax=Hetaerina americana TaxID=62018 RepID=UPI003A7F3F3B
MADFVDELFSVFTEQSTPLKAFKSEGDDAGSSLSSDVPSVAVGIKRDLEDDEELSGKKLKTESALDDVIIDESQPRIRVHTVETLEACTHEVAVPPDMDYQPLRAPPPGSKPAKQYPFLLDPFQKEAILCIENSQSVLVSAHTSAGKTVVAEYAIAVSLHDKQRVIYTTPIKALSNQKYREFYEDFKDVGLITGDVTINPSASCLIMTTEILRNMLYRGSEVMREVGWVIFDEIHYMRDKERGYVWEETLILLPDNVRYVFLSATIPNATQFAEWVTHLHKQPCHVVYTEYRPVPLQHYIFPAGGEGIHLVVDENGQFKEDNFNTAMAVLQNSGDASKGDTAILGKGRGGGNKSGNETNCFKIVKMIMERNFAPVIVFSFSKKECEAYAVQMASLDFNNAEEKCLVDEVFNNAMDVLSEEDRQLPQVENVLPLLRRGIGIHHGGLLPILKETIEILFSEGLIKALFATETFAMGLNMPARTVLFTGARKFDGKDFRWLTSGEYIQMSGRAGRRGLDEKGIVILMVDEQMGSSVGKEIVRGLPDPINSAFHLTYNMVLNLLRVEEINPEYMLERSFFQFQNYAAIPNLYDKVKSIQNDHDSIEIPREDEVASYYRIRTQLDNLSSQFQKYITQPQHIVPFLQPGRMVKIKNENDDFDWGIVINFKKKVEKGKGRGPGSSTCTYVVDVLLHVAKGTGPTASASGGVSLQPKPAPKDETGEMEVVPVLLELVSQISSVRLYFPNDLRPADNRMSVLKTIKQVRKRFPKGVPLLDPEKDMRITNDDFLSIVKRIRAFEERLYSHPLHGDPKLGVLYDLYSRKMKVGNELKGTKMELKKAKSLLQMDELKHRKRVLRRLGYCTASDVIEMKGRVACELSSADELLMTEMMFKGIFTDLTAAQSVALLSCFVCEEKSNDAPKISNELSGALRQMQDLARKIAQISKEAKLEINEDNYVDKFRPFLMDIVFAWCQGASFAQLCKMTEVFEGNIIRCMRRLEEVLRQLCQAAKNIGNTELENKFSEGIKLMKRDIVFAASLYL